MKVTVHREQDKLAGGRYPWGVREDGRYEIYDVEIFVEHMPPEAMGDQDLYCGRDYMDEAIKTDGILRDEQKRYIRVHKNHNGFFSGGDNEGIGYAELTDVVDRSFYDAKTKKRKQLSVLRCNFLDLTKEHFDSISRRELPYPSVEFDIKQPRIRSIALLPTANPYFDLPAITPGEQVGLREGQVGCYRAAEDDVSLLATARPQSDISYRSAVFNMKNLEPLNRMEGDDDPNHDQEVSMKEVLEAMNKGFAELRECITGKKADDTEGKPAPGAPQGGPVDDTDPNKQGVRMDEETLKRVMAAEAKADAADAKASELAEKDNRRDAIRWAEKELKSFVIAPGKIEEKYDQAQKEFGNGKRGLELYVEAVKQHATPAPTLDPDPGNPATLPPDSPVRQDLEEFAKQGPVVARLAAEAAREYVPEANEGVTLKEFVNLRMRYDERFLRELKKEKVEYVAV